MLPTHPGGHTGTGTDVASNLFRTYQQWTASTNTICIFPFFGDLASAFYRVLRTIIAKGGPSDEVPPWVIKQLDFQPSEIHDRIQNILQLSALQAAGAPEHLESVIADMSFGAHRLLHLGSIRWSLQIVVRSPDAQLQI